MGTRKTMQPYAIHLPTTEHMCRSQKMLRVTVREDLTMEMASDLVRDLKTVIEWLDHHYMFTGEQANHRASRMKPRKDRTSRRV